ncbi:Maf family nucleotide pyrophosphatase [Algoriphagus hitonicola]|uniref:Maf family nucleotide pyrophosphatase n=1 Tax=Algoriphagus hitonicola TaxID=435880 RepID=UPI00361D02C2
MEKIKNKKIILASNSPRRRELLRGLEIDFEVKAHPIDETVPADIPADYVAAYLSKLKAESYAEQLAEDEILITSDTVVIQEGHILGKPHSDQEAFDMIKSLSGTTHKVMTAVTIVDKGKRTTLEDETLVTFRFLSEEEIWHYVKNYGPFDKAGGYGIQEWIGFVGVSRIEGSYYTVMGFPVHLIYEELKKW